MARAPRTLHEALRRLVWLLLLVALAAAGCSKSDETQVTAETLPTLRLTDDTPDLLLTWIDERGGTGTGVTPAEVPATSRQHVRVITKQAGHGKLFYVADLSHKRPDGSYPVTTMSREKWEALLAQRRERYLAARQPSPRQPRGLPPPGSRPMPRGPSPHAPDHAPQQPAPDGAITGIVYGASWCKPCHQAAAYMKKRGVHVIEHDIEKNPVKEREMRGKLRSAGRSGGSIPVIDIEGTILVGFSTRAIDRAIQKAAGGTKL